MAEYTYLTDAEEQRLIDLAGVRALETAAYVDRLIRERMEGAWGEGYTAGWDDRDEERVEPPACRGAARHPNPYALPDNGSACPHCGLTDSRCGGNCPESRT